MPASLKVIYSDGDWHTVLPGVRFNLNVGELVCGEISPPVRVGGDELKFLYFDYLVFTGETLTSNYTDISLVDGQHYAIKIVAPVPAPLPSSLNNQLALSMQKCYLQLFHVHEGQLMYIGFVDCVWKDAESTIKRMLRRKRMLFTNLRVASLDQSGHALAACIPIENFCRNLSNGKMSMALLLEIDQSLVLKYGNIKVVTSALPLVPRSLAYLIYFKMVSTASEDARQIPLRRALAACANSGVLVDLIDELDIPVHSSQFDRLACNWEDASQRPILAPIYHLLAAGFGSLDSASNEATIGAMFWSTALNAALVDFSSPASASAFNPLQPLTEWYVGAVLPGVTPNRRVDYAVLLRCLEPRLPIMLVEYSPEIVPSDKVHKDFTKMACMLSQFCRQQAHYLFDKKRRPENARVYGLLVGGQGGARLMVAHPVVSRLPSGEDQIHVVVSSPPEWTIDLSGPSDGLESRETVNPTERLLQATAALELGPMNLDEDTRIRVVYRVTSSERQRARAQAAAEARAQAQAPPQVQPPQPAATTNQSLSSLAVKQLHFIGQLVRSSARLICTDDASTAEGPGRSFVPMQGVSVIIPAARGTAQQDTPFSERVSGTGPCLISSPSTSPSARAASKRRRRTDALVQIMQRVSRFPVHFPRILEMEACPDDPESMTLCLETLKSLVDEQGNLHPSLFSLVPVAGKDDEDDSDADYDDEDADYDEDDDDDDYDEDDSEDEPGCQEGASEAEVLLNSVSKLMMDCLVQLHLLHEEIGFVHTAISHNNVAFSAIDGVWKLTGLEDAIANGASLPAPSSRLRHLTAPETVQSGLFSPASDVFSLGRVLEASLLGPLTAAIYGDEEACDRVGGLGTAVVGAILAMGSDDAKQRPSVRELISLLLPIAGRVNYPSPADIPLQVARGLVNAEQPPSGKRPREDTEKENIMYQ